MASTEAMGFQWGVKVFSEEFDFVVADAVRMCDAL
jgi:hypothetical protein